MLRDSRFNSCLFIDLLDVRDLWVFLIRKFGGQCLAQPDGKEKCNFKRFELRAVYSSIQNGGV